MAEAARDALQRSGKAVDWLDLREVPFDIYNPDSAKAPAVAELGERIAAAEAVILAVPVYNFNVNSAAKALIEYTNKSWCDQVVGFIAAAGGMGSYMSLMGIMNSLMLDYRCIIVPRFVYGLEKDLRECIPQDLQERIEEVGERVAEVGQKLRGSTASTAG